MSKKYIAIECENSKYCKDVPYISKKEFRKNEDNVIVGKTRLKKYKSSSEEKELDLLLFDNKEFVDILDVYNAIKTSKRIYPDTIIKELNIFREKFKDMCIEENIVLPEVKLEDINNNN